MSDMQLKTLLVQSMTTWFRVTKCVHHNYLAFKTITTPLEPLGVSVVFTAKRAAHLIINNQDAFQDFFIMGMSVTIVQII